MSDPLKYFPYEPRFRQEKVIRELNKLIESGSRILFDAPTGYGKTPVVLAASLPIVEEYGVPILWVVRTGNETDRPIEELAIIDEKLGLNFFGLSIRGKKDMCLLARSKGIRDQEGVSVLCRRMRKNCPYYAHLATVKLSPQRPLLFSQILELGEKNHICPYFAQLILASSADVISMSYNYVFSERIKWSLMSYVRFKGAILVVDEAHNLQHLLSTLNSDQITIGTVERAINEVKQFHDKKSVELGEKLKRLLQVLKEEAKKLGDEEALFDPLEIVNRADLTDEDFEHARRLISKIYTMKLREGKSPRSSLRHLIYFLENALEFVDKEGIVFLRYREKDRIVFEIWDMRASEVLMEIWHDFYSVVLMSGTLKPYDAFAEIVGLINYDVVSDKFDIQKENVLSLIIKDVTTKGEELPNDMKEKYGCLLEDLVRNIQRNMAIFFASYRIMNDLVGYVAKIAREMNRRLFIEYETLSGDEARKILEEFKNSEAGILCASMQGRFSEGIDLPGKALEAIILVGIPFDRLTIRTKLYIDYYTKLYGEEKGRFYAYILPALRRASQALGRAIRSPQDRALLIAADYRYGEKRYSSLLPYFFRINCKIVNKEAAIEFIQEFFEKDHY
ncbi:MAG: ATP-dependent DNA helicase [Candidatus Njordarchaeales archaeon]